ncbi:MAG: hypothetical protein AB7Q00_09065 [Phycisphaerales bacterium]
MTERTTKHEPTAAETYAARANDIARLIDVLEMHLQVHAEGAKADPANWGRVGDLGKVRSDLIDLVGFMANMGRATVEEFLNDAE